MARSPIVLSLALIAVGTGCGSETENPTGNEVVIAGFERPSELLQGYEAAIAARDPKACAALLEEPSDSVEGFRFVPHPDCAAEIAWLEGGSWGYDDELLIVANLFDPEFVVEDFPMEGFAIGVEALTGGAVERDVHEFLTDALLEAFVDSNDG